MRGNQSTPGKMCLPKHGVESGIRTQSTRVKSGCYHPLANPALLPNLFLRALALLVGNKMKVVSHLNVIGLTWLLRQKDRQQGYHCDKHRTQKITPCSNPPPARQYQWVRSVVTVLIPMNNRKAFQKGCPDAVFHSVVVCYVQIEMRHYRESVEVFERNSSRVKTFFSKIHWNKS